MPNSFVYVQLSTSDLERATAFYSDLFGWSIDATTDYREIDVGGGTAGGMMRSQSRSAPSFWLPYVGVDDVDSMAARAKEFGADVLVSPADVPGKGRYAIVRDPAGATFALFTALRDVVR